MTSSYDSANPGLQRMAVKFIDESIVPLITGSADLWRMVSRLALWRGKPATALDAEEESLASNHHASRLGDGERGSVGMRLSTLRRGFVIRMRVWGRGRELKGWLLVHLWQRTGVSRLELLFEESWAEGKLHGKGLLAGRPCRAD